MTDTIESLRQRLKAAELRCENLRKVEKANRDVANTQFHRAELGWAQQRYWSNRYIEKVNALEAELDYLKAVLRSRVPPEYG